MTIAQHDDMRWRNSAPPHTHTHRYIQYALTHTQTHTLTHAHIHAHTHDATVNLGSYVENTVVATLQK